ncbi:MAG TPA: sigma 54 modulation/S30EA ribosomal C-terminal domain-containing protein [Jatrophihabitans sp.]|nr:sigma 54 modulation/S30EA ribosomal C-terminal domain-containing protein [Jatrophihabitans sp.]
MASATGALIEAVEPAGGVAVAEAGDDEGLPDGPGQVVREKEHPAKPMTIDQALFEMELVGHDFYLFADADSGRPSVVYRRHGYDYGVIRLVE